jgi:hypothetical protein
VRACASAVVWLAMFVNIFLIQVDRYLFNPQKFC